MGLEWSLSALRAMDRKLVQTRMIDCPACRRAEKMRVEPRPALINFLGEDEPHLYYEIHCNECGYTFLWKTWRTFDPEHPDKELTTLSPEEQLAADPRVLDS